MLVYTSVDYFYFKDCSKIQKHICVDNLSVLSSLEKFWGKREECVCKYFNIIHVLSKSQFANISSKHYILRGDWYQFNNVYEFFFNFAEWIEFTFQLNSITKFAKMHKIRPQNVFYVMYLHSLWNIIKAIL